MTRTCELEHATMQTRSHGHKIQIEILAIQITASRFDAADAMSTVNSVVAMTLQVAQETRHCISLHHCIALKWDLALKNLEPSHIAHMLGEIAALPWTSDARNRLTQAWSTMDGTRTHICSVF